MIRILYVEDSEVYQRELRRLLEKEKALDFTLDTAINIEEAITYVESKQYDFIFIDVTIEQGSQHLPFLGCFPNGTALARYLRGKTNARMIAASASSLREQDGDGFDDLVLKPFGHRG